MQEGRNKENVEKEEKMNRGKKRKVDEEKKEVEEKKDDSPPSSLILNSILQTEKFKSFKIPRRTGEGEGFVTARNVTPGIKLNHIISFRNIIIHMCTL